MDQQRSNSKLRKLVYAGLAGGLVGVSGMSLAAHGNASPATQNGTKITWDAEDFVVQDAAPAKAEAPTK